MAETATQLFNRVIKGKFLTKPEFINAANEDPAIFKNTGLHVVYANMTVWKKVVLRQMKEGMREWAKRVERDMQKNAKWHDQTGQGRGSLRAYLFGDDPRIPDYADIRVGPEEEIRAKMQSTPDGGEDLFVVATGFMSYIHWLEIRWGGRLAIIWPTINENAGDFVPLMVKYGKKAP